MSEKKEKKAFSLPRKPMIIDSKKSLAIKEWIKKEWPFKKPYWSNKELPNL